MFEELNEDDINHLNYCARHKFTKTHKMCARNGVFACYYTFDETTQNFQMLVLIRADGLVGFIGGSVDDGEDLLTALEREVREEVGKDGLTGFCNGDAQPLCTNRIESATPYHTHLFMIDAGSVEHLQVIGDGFRGASHRHETAGYAILGFGNDHIINRCGAMTMLDEMAAIRHQMMKKIKFHPPTE